MMTAMIITAVVDGYNVKYANHAKVFNPLFLPQRIFSRQFQHKLVNMTVIILSELILLL